jgi:hypothetical protein
MCSRGLGTTTQGIWTTLPKVFGQATQDVWVMIHNTLNNECPVKTGHSKYHGQFNYKED